MKNKNLGITKVDLTIPEKHKNIVRERIRKSNENPELLLKWEDIKDDFDLD